MTNDRNALQRSLESWARELQELGLRMNKRKTEVMKIARVREELNIEVDGERVREVEKFKYLGVTVNAGGEMEGEIEERIAEYSSKVRRLYPLLKNRHVPRKVKVVIYTTILRPTLIYGSEAWTLTTRTRSRVVAAEMRVLRVIFGVTRWDRKRNEDVRRELNVEPIENLIVKQQLKWYGHVRRMNPDRYPARMHNWQPQGRRPAGRPRKRWGDGVAAAVEARGRTMEDIEEEGLYLDRVRWRDFLSDRALP